MTYATTMTSKGQITVAAPLRKQLHLRPGASMNMEFRDNGFFVSVNDWQSNLAEFRAKAALHREKYGIKTLSDEELDDAINEAAAQAAVERYQRSSEG